MQLTAKLKNKSTTWSALLRPRVGDVVIDTFGDYYENSSGKNAILTDTNTWLKLTNFASPVPDPIDKDAGDITGSDPVFSIDLSGEGLPEFPASISVYVDLPGDGSWSPGPVPRQYNPVSGIMTGFDNPTDYPDQKIKIIVV